MFHMQHEGMSCVRRWMLHSIRATRRNLCVVRSLAACKLSPRLLHQADTIHTSDFAALLVEYESDVQPPSMLS